MGGPGDLHRGFAMSAVLRGTAVWVVCVSGWLVALPTQALAESAYGVQPGLPVAGDGEALSIGSALVVPDAQWLDQGQQLWAAKEAIRRIPEAVVAREESQSKYEGWSPARAATL